MLTFRSYRMNGTTVLLKRRENVRSCCPTVSDRTIAHEVVTFCNRADTVCRTVRRTVESFYKNGTKTERNVNIIKSHTVSYPVMKHMHITWMWCGVFIVLVAANNASIC